MVEVFEVEAAAFTEVAVADSTAAADVACMPDASTAAVTGVAHVLHIPSPAARAMAVPDMAVRVIPSRAVPVTVTGDATPIADMVRQQR